MTHLSRSSEARFPLTLALGWAGLVWFGLVSRGEMQLVEGSSSGSSAHGHDCVLGLVAASPCC